MCSFFVQLGRVLGVCIGIVAATTMADGQKTTSNYTRAKAPTAKRVAVEPPARGSIYRIETYSGVCRSVQYVPSGEVTNSERAAARQLQRAENEASYLYDLERLKQQYVSGERLMEQHRQGVQKQLYGASITTEGDASQANQGYYNNYGVYGGFPGFGVLGGYGGFYPGFGVLGGYGGFYPGFGVLGGYGLYGGYGYGSGLANAYGGRSTQRVNRSLQNGVGDEGRMKDAMAHAIAAQTTHEYADQVLRNYEKAVARAAAMPVLAKALGVQKDAAAAAKAEPSYAEDSKVTMWIGGDKYDGVVKTDLPDWVVLTTKEGEVRLRKSSIERAIVRSTPAHPKHTTASK